VVPGLLNTRENAPSSNFHTNRDTTNYDGAGNLTERTDRLGRATQYVYDGLGRKTGMIDPRGGATTYQLSIFLGFVDATIDAAGIRTTTHHDNAGNQLDLVGGTGTHRAHDYTYDALNHLTRTTNDFDSTFVRYTRDFRGNLLSQTDEANNTTSYTYDLAGQLVQTTNADGTFTTQGYDGLGRLASKTDERANTTTYGYEAGCDCTDRLTSTTDPLGRRTATTYDAGGRRSSTTDGAGNQTFYLYDLRGHLVETDYVDGTSTHDTYDGLGHRVASKDQTGATTHYGYDAEGQLTSVTDSLSEVTHYAYDPNGNLTSVTDANNHVTTYAYDADNRKVTRTLPLGMSETFTYDVDSNVATHTDFRGKTTTLNYDIRNLLATKIPDPSLGEPTVSYAFNSNSTRASMVDASGSTSYTYDARNRLLTKAAPAGTLTYTYDAGGNVGSMRSSNANGTSVAYTWDAANQLVSVTDNRLGGITTAAYTATGRPFQLAQPNGVGATYAYDTLDRVTSLAWKKGTASPLASWAYTYNGRSQRLTATDVTGREAAYGYDAVSRLASETVTTDPRGTVGDGTLTYSVDSTGNRLSRTSTLASLASQAFEYDANDQLTSDGYDVNGNTTSSDGSTYSYDFETRLVSKNGGAVTIVYDGDGNRVAKTAGAVTTRYLVDDLNPTGYLQVLEEVSGGAVQVRYTYGNMLVSQTRTPSTTPATSFYGYDAHGNVTFLTDGSGAVTDTYAYDAWGNLLEQSGATQNTRLYLGEEFDPDLGLINLRARYYKREDGRFGVPGLLDSHPGESPLSSNRYLYANGEPVGQKDPLGLLAGTEYGLVVVTGPSRAFLTVAAATGGTIGGAGVVLGNKVACEFQDAADASAALSGEDVVRVDPACPEITCDCHADVIIPPSQEHRRDRDIPKQITGRGKGDTQPIAVIRCCKNVETKLSWHPANTGNNPPVLQAGKCEIDVCFPSLR
jgi:RHS repeat-associated protein